MVSLRTGTKKATQTLIFGSTMHIWSDLFFAMMVPLLPFIKKDLGLSFTQVGLLRSVFNGASAVLQIPVGILAEKTGEFWLLILGNCWVSAGLIAMALSPVFIILLVFATIAGLGGGAQHPLASSMVSRAYEHRGQSTAVGTVNFAGDLGKMVAPIATGLFTISLGWRTTMIFVGISGLIFMILSSFTRKAVNIGNASSQLSADQPLKNDTDSETLISGFITLSSVGVLDSAVRAAALVFLPFVMEAKAMGALEVSVMLFLLFAGGAAGKFICGWLGDRFGIVSIICVTKGLTALMITLTVVSPTLLMAPLLLLTGIGLNGTSSVLYATVAKFIPAKRRARFYGFYYTTNEIGTIIAPLCYGIVADRFSLTTTMMLMGGFTATILPMSLTLRKHLT